MDQHIGRPWQRLPDHDAHVSGDLVRLPRGDFGIHFHAVSEVYVIVLDVMKATP